MSAIYGRVSALAAGPGLGWVAGTWGVMLVSSAYAPSFGTDTDLSAIPSGAQLLPAPVALSSPTVVNGFCTAANVAWPSLTTAAPVHAVVVVDMSLTPPALVAYIDQGTGFNQQDNGQPSEIVWDTRGIFRL